MSIRPKYKLSYVNFDSWGKRYVTGGGGSVRCDSLWRGGGSKLAKKALRNIWTAPSIKKLTLTLTHPYP